MSKLFGSDDDDLGYLDDTVHINWKKFLPAIIIAAVAVIALIIVLIVSFGHKGKKTLSNVSSTEETSSVNGTDADGNNTLSDKDEKELDPQYSDTDGSLSGETAAAASPDVEAGMVFTSVNDTVTAKDEVRLRDKPSQDTDATVITTLVNGETVTRTGTSNSGWSRLVYNGQTVYAVTSYLTTDLAPKTTESPTTGFNTKFTDCNDTVTPKDEVNLRNKPSVTDADSVVVATAKKGELFTRTGYNTEVGWSRVIYNGQTLYCVTSLLSIQ